MKKLRILLFLVVASAFFLAATQAFASPAELPNAKNTPGANATQKAEEKATQQAEKEADAAKQPGKNDKPKGKRENFKGTIAASDASSFTLTLRDGSSVTVGLTADTRIKFPGPKNAAPGGLAVGMTATVQAIRDENGSLTALRVMVIPGKPSKIHRVGIVTAYTPSASITIQDKDGNTFTFALTGEIKILPPERAGQLAVGARVTLIAPRDPASGGVSVIGIVVHPAKP